MKGYSLCIDEKQAPQDPQTLSFIGGYPRIPIAEDLPKCQLCGAEQSFFFQVAFPKNHVWRDLSIAVFACTSCDDEKYCVPEMLPQEILTLNRIGEDSTGYIFRRGFSRPISGIFDLSFFPPVGANEEPNMSRRWHTKN